MPKLPDGKLRDIAAAPDLWMALSGRRVVWSEQNELRVVDIDTGSESARLPCEGRFAVGDGLVVHAPTRNEPQVSDLDGTLRVKLARPAAEAFTLSAGSIDRAGTLVGTGLVYDAVIWDAKTGNVLLEHHQDVGVDDTIVSPDGASALIVRAKKATQLVDTKTMTLTPLPDLKPRTLCHVTWSQDSRIAVVWTYTEAQVFDVKAKSVVAKCKLNNARRCTFVPRQNAFLVGNSKRIVVFDTETWTERMRIEMRADLIAASVDGDRIVIGQEKLGISVWDPGVLLG